MVQQDFKSATKVDEIEDDGLQVTSYAEMEARIAENGKIAAAKRAEVAARPGGLARFKEEVQFDPIVTEQNHKLIEDFKSGKLPAEMGARILTAVDEKVGEFYEPYVASFPIKAEQEARGGLDAEAGEGFYGIVTERNFDPELKETYGEFREFMFTVRDPATNKAIGGMNFLVLPAKDGEPLEGKYAATVHSTYVFFDPAHRSLGLARHLMDARDQIAAEYAAKVAPEAAAKSSHILTVSEQNIPELMDPVSFMTDSAFAVRQEQRLEKWYSLGYNRLNFEGQDYDGYVQPALEEGGEVCDVLSLNAYAAKVNFTSPIPIATGRERVDGLQASTLRHHLNGFFGTSVVGTADAGDASSPDHDPTMVDALAKLDRMGNKVIPTFDYEQSMEKLTKLKAQITDFLSTATPAEIHSEKQIIQLIEEREARHRRPEAPKPTGLG